MRVGIITFSILSVLAGPTLAAPVALDNADLVARDGFVGVETINHPDKRTATQEGSAQPPGSENGDQKPPPSLPKPVFGAPPPPAPAAPVAPQLENIGDKGRWADFINFVKGAKEKNGGA